MNDASQPSHFDAVARYAELVRRLRAGKAVAPPPPDPDDPLAALGHELVSLAAELAHREAELQRLFELVQNAEHGVSPEDVLDRIFDGFSDLIPYDRIGCAFLIDDGERLKAHWARSNLGPARLVAGFSRPMAGSSLQQILETRQPRILNDLEAYLEAKPFSLSTRLVVEEGGRSSLTCPLIANGRPIGFLFFTSREVNAYRDIHQAIFNQIANQISIVIEKSRIFQQIAYAARHDALTGLPNRALFFETLTRALGRVGEDGSLAVLYLDLDHFKRVNDTLGHPVGDALLKKMARRLRRCVGARGAVARLGGDEFAVIHGPIASAAEVATLADEIGEAVRAPLTHRRLRRRRRRFDRRRDRAGARRRSRRTGEEGRRRALRREESRPRRLSPVPAGNDRARHRADGGRARPAPRARQWRVRTPLPADRQPRRRPHRRGRSAGALAPPAARARPAGASSFRSPRTSA